MDSSSASRGETNRSFLQSRVALLGLVLTGIGVFGLSMSVIDASDDTPRLWYILSLADAALWIALWLSCRGRPRSVRFCRVAEAICILSTGVLFAANTRLLGTTTLIPSVDPMSWGTEPRGQFLGLTRMYWATAHLYGLTLYCVLRAALVPSRSGRTLVLTFLVGVPLAVFTGMPSLPWDPPDLANAAIPETYAFLGVLNVAMQWVFTVAACGVLSRVIYGLRRELHHARRLGQYTLEAKIGEGGMGTVYRASHAMMRWPTAIKLLSPAVEGGNRIARFEREVQETARLTHPNTITVFDYGRTPEGVFYYVMEMLDGASAEAVVNETGPMPPVRVIHVLRGVCCSLEEAHGIGLIHRDIKPANIVLCSQGGRPDVPKLLDFGLVKEAADTADAGLTVEGTVAGTPMYMAPEMITGPDSIDARADLYAIGAVGYFLLTGKPVFEGCHRHGDLWSSPPLATAGPFEEARVSRARRPGGPHPPLSTQGPSPTAAERRSCLPTPLRLRRIKPMGDSRCSGMVGRVWPSLRHRPGAGRGRSGLEDDRSALLNAREKQRRSPPPTSARTACAASGCAWACDNRQ